MSLSSSTWRALGLSVAVGYISLGTFAITQPVLSAQGFGLYPTAALSSATDPIKTDRDEHASAICTSMALLGARDLSIGVALATLHYRRQGQEMGVLICSGLILCAVDVLEIWRRRGAGWGAAFGVGASTWAVIGWNLLQGVDYGA